MAVLQHIDDLADLPLDDIPEIPEEDLEEIPLEWNDLFDMDYDQLKALYDRHQTILKRKSVLKEKN